MNKDELKEIAYYAGLVSQIGLTVAFSILIGILVGVFLDKKFGTSPLFIAIFTLIGVVGGFVSAYKQIMAKPK